MQDDLSQRCGRIRDSGFAVAVPGHGGSGFEDGKMAADGGASSQVPPPSIKAFEIRYTKTNRITWIGRGGSGNPGRLEGFVRPVSQRAWFTGFLWELEKLARVDIKKTKEIHDPNIPILPHIPVYLHLCLFVWKF